MTRRAARAGAIRKLTPDEAVRIDAAMCGVVLDETLPAAAVDLFAMQAWIKVDHVDRARNACARALGIFRWDVARESSALPPAHQAQLADELLELITELQERLVTLPPALSMIAKEHAALRLHRDFREIATAADAALEAVANCVRPAVERIRSSKARGRRANWPRNHLVREIDAVLHSSARSGTKQKTIDYFAHELLQACEIDHPGDLAQRRKLAKRMGL
ncbi:hypothetical protein [Metallibacterium sp.]|uniref:hypothetical protein n=1 Tax=Metallibacterium sp. TaxID=2940281 RepID=UPI00260B9730|nr:hypothetical protein [Metallibacterium sp.]